MIRQHPRSLVGAEPSGPAVQGRQVRMLSRALGGERRACDDSAGWLTQGRSSACTSSRSPTPTPPNSSDLRPGGRYHTHGFGPSPGGRTFKVQRVTTDSFLHLPTLTGATGTLVVSCACPLVIAAQTDCFQPSPRRGHCSHRLDHADPRVAPQNGVLSSAVNGRKCPCR